MNFNKGTKQNSHLTKQPHLCSPVRGASRTERRGLLQTWDGSLWELALGGREGVLSVCQGVCSLVGVTVWECAPCGVYYLGVCSL